MYIGKKNAFIYKRKTGPLLLLLLLPFSHFGVSDIFPSDNAMSLDRIPLIPDATRERRTVVSGGGTCVCRPQKKKMKI